MAAVLEAMEVSLSPLGQAEGIHERLSRNRFLSHPTTLEKLQDANAAAFDIGGVWF